MAAKYPKPMTALIQALETLPGIGARTAERLALHLLKQPANATEGLASAIRTARAEVRYCSRCFNLTQDHICSICKDEERDQSLLAVVESPRELLAMEKSGRFQGIYHCLLGRIAPVEGIGPRDLTIDALVKRLDQEPIEEVVLATNPDLGGDATALAVSREIGKRQVRITRLARGLPVGHQLESLSSNVLEEALIGRAPLPLDGSAAHAGEGGVA